MLRALSIGVIGAVVFAIPLYGQRSADIAPHTDIDNTERNASHIVLDGEKWDIETAADVPRGKVYYVRNINDKVLQFLTSLNGILDLRVESWGLVSPESFSRFVRRTGTVSLTLHEPMPKNLTEGLSVGEFGELYFEHLEDLGLGMLDDLAPVAWPPGLFRNCRALYCFSLPGIEESVRLLREELPQLKTLSMQYWSNARAIKGILQTLCPEIQTLHLDGRLHQKWALLEELLQVPTLKVLSLDTIDDTDVSDISDKIVAGSNLEALTLSTSVGKCQEGLAGLAARLPRLRSLSVLGWDAVHVARVLKAPALESLVWRSGTSSVPWEELVALLPDPDRLRLTHIDFRRSPHSFKLALHCSGPATGSVAASLGEGDDLATLAARTPQGLVSLILDAVRNQKAVADLSGVLRSERLEVLGIRDFTELTGFSADNCRCKKLRGLDLAGCRTVPNLEAIAASGWESLRVLDLTGWTLNERAFWKLMKANPGLRVLTLTNTKLMGLEEKALLDGSMLRSVESLSLAGAGWLNNDNLDALGSMPQLRTVGRSGSSVSLESVRELLSKRHWVTVF